MYLCDGYSTIVQIYPAPGGGEIITYLRARSVKLPALNGGPPIDTHTMYNQQVVTKGAQGLFEYDDMTMQCQYDIQSYVAIEQNAINKNCWFNVWLPDSSGFGFWGCLYKFDPAELRKGEFPLAEVSVGLLNRSGTTGIEVIAAVSSNNVGSDAWPPDPRPRGTLNR